MDSTDQTPKKNNTGPAESTPVDPMVEKVVQTIVEEGDDLRSVLLTPDDIQFVLALLGGMQIQGGLDQVENVARQARRLLGRFLSALGPPNEK